VLTALWAAELLAAAGLPDGLFQIVHGAGSLLGTALIERCDHICFTGSTATGRLVAEQAGRRLIGVSLELGGKSSLYVAEDADLDRAAEAAVRDCFASAGQLCVSIERLIVHERIADAFLDRFVDRVRRLRLGAGLDFSADFGSLISADQLHQVSSHVDDARAHGATVLAGGRARPDVGPLFYEPTVLTGVTPAAACYQQETFGPVVSVYRVGSDGEALTLANTGEYGLNASIWTRDLARGRRLARQVRAGTVAVNEAFIATWGSVAAPMGGHRDSGLGRRHGPEGLLRFTESQTVAVQRGMGFGPMYSIGGERMSAAFTTALRLARAAHLPWP
jgi:succinate-semialdehyde dehydrogenase / glutarate-semialdehyde dehydrogenase